MYQQRVETIKDKDKKSMTNRERTWMLQSNLYRKAKQEKGYKFYILYDKIFLLYILEEAWAQVRENGGGAGVDGVTIADIKSGDVQAYLSGIREELRRCEYKPQAVKRVWIPKPNGDKRPLGIPTVKDRIVQTACKLILEPIFEADFQESSYGFRPERSASDAIREIKTHLKSGLQEVYDADLSKYFDTIPHDKLMITLRERITDPRVLSLIEMWLKAPVNDGGKFTGGKKNKVGTPQGGVISPLLANIYMNLIDRIISREDGGFAKMGIKIVRYADDFVLMGRHITSQALDYLKSLISRMGLSINEGKTRLINAKEESFNFLGFTFRYDKSLLEGTEKYWNVCPSDKSMKKLREKIDAYLKTHGHCNGYTISTELNSIIKGSLNYYKIQGVSYTRVACRALNHYLHKKLYRFYNRKSQRKSRLYGQRAKEILETRYGLVNVLTYKRQTT